MWANESRKLEGVAPLSQPKLYRHGAGAAATRVLHGVGRYLDPAECLFTFIVTWMWRGGTSNEKQLWKGYLNRFLERNKRLLAECRLLR